MVSLLDRNGLLIGLYPPQTACDADQPKAFCWRDKNGSVDFPFFHCKPFALEKYCEGCVSSPDDVRSYRFRLMGNLDDIQSLIKMQETFFSVMIGSVIVVKAIGDIGTLLRF